MIMRLSFAHFLRFCCVSALALGVVGYLGYHALYGRKGLLALEMRQQEQAVLSDQLSGLVSQRETLQRRTKSLVPPVREDMLVEQARLSLNYVQPTEKVLLVQDLLPDR